MFFHCCFWDFLFVIQQFDYMCNCDFICAYLLSIETFRSVDNIFIQFGNFGAMISLDDFLPYSFSSPYGAPITWVCVLLLLSHRYLMLLFLFSTSYCYSFDWIISSDLLLSYLYLFCYLKADVETINTFFIKLLYLKTPEFPF